MSVVSVFFWATFGGMFNELLHWVGLKKEENFPIYFRSYKYWVVSILTILFGGLFTVAISESGNALSPLTAVLIGYSAPSIVQKLAREVPPVALGVGALNKPSVIKFLGG